MLRLRSALPNLLTWSRVVLSPVIVVCAFFSEYRIFELVLITYCVVSDKLDGMLARAWKVESEHGKKVESIADPLFSIAAGIYVLLRTDFPIWIFWYGLILFGANTLGRLIVYICTRQFFYQKSQVTRYSTAVIFAAILLYIYSIPGRNIFIYFGVAYGTFTMLNYLLMEYNFVRSYKKSASK